MVKRRKEKDTEQRGLTDDKRPDRDEIEGKITDAADLVRQDWQLMAKGWQGAFPTVAQLRDVERRSQSLRGCSLQKITPAEHEMRMTDKCFLIGRCQTHAPTDWDESDDERSSAEERVFWIGETDLIKDDLMRPTQGNIDEEDVCLMDEDGKLWTFRQMLIMGIRPFNQLIARPATDEEVLIHRSFFEVTNREVAQLAIAWRRVFQGETTTR